MGDVVRSPDGSIRRWPPQSGKRLAGSLSPWVAFPLVLPFGLSGGYTTVALIFLLSRNGVSTAAIGGFLFVSLIPQTLKFLYAPLIDTTLGPRRWHLVGTAATALSLVTIAFVPPLRTSLGLLTILAFLSTVAVTFVATPADVIIAYDVAPDRKGGAAGWGMAANLGGSAVGGGVALWIAAHGAPVWAPPIVLAVLCLLCAPFLLLVAERELIAADTGWLKQQAGLLHDVWTMLRSRAGALMLLLAILPVGTGAMQNLLPALAADWRAGATEVATVSGGVAGVLQIIGALLGGWLSDRFNRRWTYCLAGALLAGISVAMAMGPRNPDIFVAFSLAYVFVLGVSYSAFAGAVFEAIGKGAAASKYTLIICVSNVAIFGETALEGWVHDHLSLTSMLYMEALGAALAILVFGLACVFTRRDIPRLVRGPLSVPPAA